MLNEHGLSIPLFAPLSEMGGLGVTAGAVGWTRVKSVMVLHDQKWNDRWIVQWATSLDVDASLDALRAQVGFHLEPVPRVLLIIIKYLLYTSLGNRWRCTSLF